MRLNYKPIGKYIQQANVRNRDLSVTDLKGIKINKEFMPSVANTTGTDLSKYKVVRTGQFAYNPMHVGRDEVLPISMLQSEKPVIVSPAYSVFEIIDPEELDPEYLMMWCRRPEFDRNAWFTTDSSVRGGFSWESLCEMELPVPPIEKQREIVQEYNTIVNRIKLNEQINQKLEETAQMIYKHWFVDFEFPISREYALAIDKPELEGKPYQSNGGKMVWNEELDGEIPEGWEVSSIGDIAKQKRNTFKSKNGINDIAYMGLEHLPKSSITLKNWEYVNSIGSNKSIFKDGDILFGKLRPYFHKVGIAFISGICSTDIIVINPLKEDYYGYLTMVVSSKHFIAYTTAGSGGTKMPRTNWEYMTEYPIALPPTNVASQFNNYFLHAINRMKLSAFSNRYLKEFTEIILQKLSQPKAKKLLL